MSRAEISERWRKNHPERARASRRKAAEKWRRAHPQEARVADRAKHLKRKYGLSPLEWDLKFIGQNRCCDACCTPHGPWHTDHNHTTGQLRGILCRKCNTALGVLENEPLRVALEVYLEKHK